MNKINNCDNCKYYKWYYDYCEKWKCEVDDREVHSCFEKRGEADGDKEVELALKLVIEALGGETDGQTDLERRCD